MRRRTVLCSTILFLASVGTIEAASAADMPRSYRHGAPGRVYYEPRGPVPVLAYAPRYRVIYQVPSDECAENDFCPAAL